MSQEKIWVLHLYTSMLRAIVSVHSILRDASNVHVPLNGKKWELNTHGSCAPRSRSRIAESTWIKKKGIFHWYML